MAEHDHKHVVGNWKQFTFKMASPKDYPKILAHLRAVFYVDEPFSKLSQYGPEEFEQLDAIVLNFLNRNDDLSFYVEETETGKIAAVRTTYKSCKTDPDTGGRPGLLPKIQAVVGFLKIVNKEANIFERYGIDFYANFLMTSVEPEFRRQGLVTEIYRRSLALLRARGYPACKSVFSSPFTRQAVTKLGFEELSRLHFVDYKDEQGLEIIPGATPGEFGSVNALRL